MTPEQLMAIAQQSSSPAQQGGDVSLEQIQKLHEAYKAEQSSLWDAAQAGLATNIIGTLGMIPDAMVGAHNLRASAINWAAGEEMMPKIGSTLSEEVIKAVGADVKPSEMTESEKAAYYASQGVPLVGAPSMLRSSLGMGLKSGVYAATRQTAMDVGTAYAAGRLGEENPWLGMALGITGGIATANVSPYRVTSTDPLTGAPLAASRQLQADYGIQETKGMSMWRASQSMPEGLEREKSMAAAIDQLAAEAKGRESFTGPQAKLNYAQWVEADNQRLDQVSASIRGLAGIAGSTKDKKTLSNARNAIYESYDAWKTGTIEDFRAANNADFGNIDKTVQFSTEETANVLMRMMSDPELSDANIAFLRKELNKFVKYGEDGETIEGFRAMNAETVKSMLSEYGKMAYGRGERFRDLPRGVQTFYGGQLLQAMNKTLDTATGAQGEAADALRQARKNFSERLKKMQANSQLDLIQFFEDGSRANPQRLAQAIADNAQDPDAMMLFKTMLMGDGSKEQQQLYNDTKEAVFNYMFEESFKGSGRLSLNSIQNNIAALKDNVFFFDEGARLTAANKLFQDLEGVLEAQRYIGSEADTAYMQAKAASEALGTVGGAKARYGGELAVKAILLQRFRNLDPKTVAKMANDPTSTYQLVRYLQGDAKQPNLAQIKAARNVGLADWATKVAQINTMFNNQDKEQTKEQQRVLGLFGL